MYNEKIEDFLFALTFRLRSNAILHMSRTRSIVFGYPGRTDLEAVTFQGDALCRLVLPLQLQTPMSGGKEIWGDGFLDD